MKKTLAGIYIFFVSFTFAFAAPVAPANIILVSNTANSITFSWDKVPDTLGYYLYWGVNNVNENEEISPIEGNEFTLKNLQGNTKYKIALTTVNNSGEESELSAVKTLSTSATSNASQDFQLLEVKTLDEMNLEFSFNNKLENSESAQRDFLIIDSKTGIEQKISDIKLDPKNTNLLTVTLANPLSLTTSYDVTVLAIKDINGKTIENGIDAVTNFTTPASFDIELNSAGPEEVSQTGSIIENSPETVTTTETGGPGGQLMASDDLEKHTLVAAKQNDNLPQTGPEHIILLILSLLAGATYFFFMRTQKNS